MPYKALERTAVGAGRWRPQRCHDMDAPNITIAARTVIAIAVYVESRRWHFFLRLEHFHKSCSAAESDLRKAVFLVFGFVSAQLQDFQTCAFAKASPTTKNPRSSSLHHFCQCSRHREHAIQIICCDWSYGIIAICRMYAGYHGHSSRIRGGL